MGAYENPGQFQIYDPTGDIMLAQAFSQVGTNLMKALQERKQKAKETIFKSFQLNEKEREAQAKQDAVIANAALDANFDVTKMRDFIDGLKDEQFKLSQKRNSYISRGEVPPQDLTDQYDQISSTIRIGVPTLLNTYKQFNEAGNQVTQGALGDQGGTSALVNSTAMDLFEKFSSSTKGKYKMGWITDSDGKRELGFIAEDGMQASFTGLSEAASYYGRKVPNADQNFEDSEVIKQQQTKYKELFTPGAIQTKIANDGIDAARKFYKDYGNFRTVQSGNTVKEIFVLDTNKLANVEASESALDNRAAEVVANSTPEQLEDIYNSVLMTVTKKEETDQFGKKTTRNVFVNATTGEEGDVMLFDGNTTPEEIESFKTAYKDHYRSGISRGLAETMTFNTYTVKPDTTKEKPIDTTGVIVAENLLDLPIAKQFQVVGGEGVMTEDQEVEMLDNFIKTANAAGKGMQYIPASALEETILSQNVDAGGNPTTSTDPKKAIPILKYYEDEKGAKNPIDARQMILDDYKNKFGEAAIYKLDKGVPRELTTAEKKRLKTYTGRYELIGESVNINDRTNEVLKEIFGRLDSGKITIEQLNAAGGIDAILKQYK